MSLKCYVLCILLLLAAWGGVHPTVGIAQQLAFPSAEGFGRYAQGGRGGTAIYVTRIDGNRAAEGYTPGNGSLRACLEASGPRTCIFRVGGLIDLQGCEGCFTIPDFLTIAGQTAPGDGVMIKGWEMSLQFTSHIIVRHLRIRSGVMPWDGEGNSSAGSVECYGSNNIIYDHLSLGWGHDDTIYSIFCTQLTTQWSLISEGMSCPGPQCGGSKANLGGPCDECTYHHNFIANLYKRVPAASSFRNHYVNNVVYNTGIGSAINPGFNGEPPLHVQFVNNYYFRGPGSDPNDTIQPALDYYGHGIGGNPATIDASTLYLSGNFHNTTRPNNSFPEDSWARCDGPPCSPIVGSPQFTMALPSQTDALQARVDVLAKAGAIVPARDSIDSRAVNSMINNSGGTWDTYTTDTFGGYPAYASGTPYPDADGDGISDAWEDSRGLNKNSAADGPAIHANGWSNLENFLNELAGDTVPGLTPGTRPPRVGPPTALCIVPEEG